MSFQNFRFFNKSAAPLEDSVLRKLSFVSFETDANVFEIFPDAVKKAHRELKSVIRVCIFHNTNTDESSMAPLLYRNVLRAFYITESKYTTNYNTDAIIQELEMFKAFFQRVAYPKPHFWKALAETSDVMEIIQAIAGRHKVDPYSLHYQLTIVEPAEPRTACRDREERAYIDRVTLGSVYQSLVQFRRDFDALVESVTPFMRAYVDPGEAVHLPASFEFRYPHAASSSSSSSSLSSILTPHAKQVCIWKYELLRATHALFDRYYTEEASRGLAILGHGRCSYERVMNSARELIAQAHENLGFGQTNITVDTSF